jgi:aquaporin Z
MAEKATQPDAAVLEEALIEEELIEEIWIEEKSPHSLLARLGAEVAGTFMLVLLGVGTALFMSIGQNGTLTVGLAFGVAVVIGATAFGHISGAHFNPAITFGVWLSGRFPGRDAAPYVLAQLVGATLAGGALYAITLANPQIVDSVAAKGVLATGANVFGDASAGKWGIVAALLVEVIATAILVLAVLAATSVRGVKSLAPFIIGLTLAFVLIFAIPVTNGSVNPARSTGIALFAGTDALSQLWVFWIAPLVGAAIVGLLYRAFGTEEDVEEIETIDFVTD